SVYFLGDSITEGTKNNHHPWYEPMKHLIKGNVYNYSKGGYIVQNLINDKDKINKRTAEVYVIAIGTNDVRKGTTKSSAKNGDQYVKKIGKLISNIQEKNSEAKFVLIPPFISRKNDPVSTRSYKDKLKMNSEFAEALKKYCDDNSYTYINPNKYIKERCQKYGYDDYLLDYIHPGPNRGILTYSRAALLYK
ncbi:MAG: SGNH/GDSL hydrolase family protein, partial [Clostridia bacterium]|nr:SGNH/GDSL hydrolase family protein [Clostridia bacterium]